MDATIFSEIINEIIEKYVVNEKGMDTIIETNGCEQSIRNEDPCANEIHCGDTENFVSNSDEESDLLDQLSAVIENDDIMSDFHELSNDNSQVSNVEPENKSLGLKGYSVRAYGPVRLVVNLPLMAAASDCAVFDIECEKFPVQMMEDELIPLFEKFGQVYKLKKITHKNRILVTYTNTKDAEKAIESLNGSNIQGHNVKVFKNVPNGRLVVRPIPYTATKKYLMQLFGSITYNLQSVTLYNSRENENRNRGFCYLTYGNHEDALAAKKLLSSRMIYGFNLPLKVDFPSRRLMAEETFDKLYIINLRSGLNVNHLQKIFAIYGEIVDIRQFGHFAIVEFKNSEDGKRAAREVDKSQLGNENVEIRFSTFCEYLEPKKVFMNPSVKSPTNRQMKSPINTPTKLQKEEVDSSDTVYVNNLHSTITATDLRKMFSSFGTVMEIDKNGAFAAIRFRNPEQSARAAQQIDKNQLGVDAQISLAKITKNPEKVSDMLYVRNLRSDITTSELRSYFEFYGQVTEIDKNGNIASIRFQNANDCQRAHNIDKEKLGKEAEISFSPEKKRPRKLPELTPTLYINNLYADMTIQRLRELFSVYGDVIQLDKEGNSATIRFKNIVQSDRAAREISVVSLGKKDVEISFVPQTEEMMQKKWSEVSDTLYLNNLYADMTPRRLREVLSLYGEILEIDIEKADNSAAVKFRNNIQSHRAALDVHRVHLGKKNLEISLVHPEKPAKQPVQKELTRVSRTLYIRNMYPDMKDWRLRQIFSEYGDVVEIVKRQNYAEVTFRNNSHLERAARQLNRELLGDENLEISSLPKN